MALSPIGLRYVTTGIRPFLASIADARRAIGGLSATGRGLGTSLGSIGRQAQTAGLGLTFMATVPIVTAMAGAVRASSAFEDELIKLNTLSGLSQKEIEKLRVGILSLAPALGKAPGELAEAAFFITSTGDLRNAAVALEVLEASAKASAIGLGETKVVAGVVTSVLAAYGQENINAAQATDILVAAVDRGKFEADQLAPALGRVLGLSAELGVSFAEATNFIATYTLSGLTASQATTSLQRVLISILKPTEGALAALDKVGISLENIQDSIRKNGLTTALLELESRFDAAGVPMSDFFTRATGLQGVLFNTGEAADLFVENLRAIEGSAGIVERGFSTVQQSVSFQMEQLKASFGVLGIAVGNALIPAINAALSRIVPLVIALSDLAAQNPRMVMLAAGFALMTAAIGPLLLAFGFLASSFGGIGGLLKAFGLILLGPISGLHQLGATLFGIVPAIKAFAGALSLVRAAGLKATISAVASSLLTLGTSFLSVVVPIGIALAAIVGFGVILASVLYVQFKAADKSFADFAKAALEWGKNIIIELARGILIASIYVVKALRQLGEVIAKWLSPGSPPKLLPDLPEWGASAMSEFLNGFNSANFDVFNTIADRIEQFMRAMAPEDDLNLIPGIMNMREIIAQLVRDAEIALMPIENLTGDVISGIISSWGIAEGAAANYIATMLQLAAAQERVKEIQEEINQVNEDFDSATEPLNDELEAIEDRRDEIRDQQRIDELESILEDPTSSDLAKELALLELREIELRDQLEVEEDARDAALEALEEKLRAAEEEKAALEEQAAVQEALLAAQETQNELMREQADLLKQVAEQLGNVAGGMGSVGDAIPEGGLLDELGKGLDFENLLGEGFTSLAENIKTAFSDLAGEISAELGPLFAELGSEFTLLGETWSGVISEASQNFLDFTAAIQGENPKINLFLSLIPTYFLAHWETAKQITSDSLESISNTISFKLETASSILVLWLNLTAIRIANKWEEIKTDTAATWELVKTSLAQRWQELGDNAKVNLDRIGTFFSEGWQNVKTETINKYAQIKAAVKTRLEEIKTDIKTKIDEMVTAVTGKLTAFYNAGASIIQGLKDGVVEKAHELVSAVSTAVLEAIAAALGLLNSSSPSKVFMQIGEDTMIGMAMGILARAQDVARAMGEAINPVIPQPAFAGSVMAPPVATPAHIAARSASSGSSNTFGPNYISNGMDEAVFTEKVRRIVAGDI